MKLCTKTCTRFLVLHFLTIIVPISIAISDTLHKGQILRDGDTLVSSGQKFELGFFTPGSSKNRYLGIWFKNTTPTAAVWVANREFPLRNTTSGILSLDQSGNLLILDGNNNKTTVWSTNASNPAAAAQLLDDGNLVIRNPNEKTDHRYTWQSFDHITDTLMAGMHFERNLATGERVELSSWKSDSDPSPGEFTLGMEIAGYPQLAVRKGESTQSRVGPFNGVRFSGSLIFKETRNQMELTMNDSMVYFEWLDTNRTTLTRFTLSPNGVGNLWMWVEQSKEWMVYYKFPSDMCDGYKACGAHGICNTVKFPVCGCLERFVPRDSERWVGFSDFSGGCVRKSPLNCSRGSDGFLKYSGIKMPDAKFTRHNSSSSLEECEAMCLRNCSCTAYSNLDIRNGGSGCQMWFGDLVDIRQLTGEKQVIYIRMAASELGSKWRRRTKLIVILTSLAGLFVLGLSLALFFVRKLMRKQETLDEINNQDMELPMFDLSTVNTATNNFSVTNKLGEGGFGSVYRGMLEDGQQIAVKRLSATSSQGHEEFKNEVICIAKLQHRNLVKLLGWCIEGEEKLLIYEYMPNKSLDLILFGEAASRHLDWPKRFHIINGIARGLLYLHQDSCLRVIHRDLKASNILLDKEFNPKISDFGMARIFRGNDTQGNTRRVVGTYGYMSPEYAIDGLFSLKSDVFSFGVLVLEIVSGHANRMFIHKDHHHNLVGHAWILYKEERPLDLVDDDPCICNSVYSSELSRCIHVALLCVQQSPEDRPSMSSVVLMLGSGCFLPQAKEPGFFAQRHVGVPEINSNDCTITQIEGR